MVPHVRPTDPEQGVVTAMTLVTGKPRYQWPASKLDEDEMMLLVAERERTGKPITKLIREAIHKAYEPRSRREDHGRHAGV